FIKLAVLGMPNCGSRTPLWRCFGRNPRNSATSRLWAKRSARSSVSTKVRALSRPTRDAFQARPFRMRLGERGDPLIVAPNGPGDHVDLLQQPCECCAQPLRQGIQGALAEGAGD